MVLKVDSPSDEDIEYCGTNNIYKVRLQPHTSYSTFKIVSNVYADFEVYSWHNLSQEEDPVKYHLGALMIIVIICLRIFFEWNKRN